MSDSARTDRVDDRVRTDRVDDRARTDRVDDRARTGPALGVPMRLADRLCA
ncbi:hypothetical protein [Streptomyces sp. NPDC005345]|uniref:hypothetical protein n=1 Tax=Streptomyces sp. NPDC005345 TaxID=3156877 RepID=UPI0033BA5CBC